MALSPNAVVGLLCSKFYLFTFLPYASLLTIGAIPFSNVVKFQYYIKWFATSLTI